jgi:hypothetical protein
MRMIATDVARSILMAAALAATVPVRMSAQTNGSEVPEYGIRATIPAGLPVCWAKSATHVHGVGTVLLGSDCENKDDQPAFNIWADGNVLFQEDALKMLAGDDRCADSPPAWANGEWTNAIGGLKTAICRKEHADGTVDLVLAAQAGEWPDDLSDVPYVNYTVNFKTTRPRQGADFEVFKKFLRSITISSPAR